MDDQAVAGEDFEPVDELLEFRDGQKITTFDVVIKDDEDWEPDEDFYVQLYDAETDRPLDGLDCRSKVTIIDDDKPGQIGFE